MDARKVLQEEGMPLAIIGQGRLETVLWSKDATFLSALTGAPSSPTPPHSPQSPSSPESPGESGGGGGGEGAGGCVTCTTPGAKFRCVRCRGKLCRACYIENNC